ncbi:MAG: RNA polymerase sigma factor [Solirubrobacteraceae bacterium]
MLIFRSRFKLPAATTQQTFLKAWRAAASLDQSREIGPWLTTIARRAAIDLRRNTRARRHLQQRRPHNALGRGSADHLPDPHRHAATSQRKPRLIPQARPHGTIHTRR